MMTKVAQEEITVSLVLNLFLDHRTLRELKPQMIFKGKRILLILRM